MNQFDEDSILFLTQTSVVHDISLPLMSPQFLSALFGSHHSIFQGFSHIRLSLIA
jgi:hypothetical protein